MKLSDFFSSSMNRIEESKGQTDSGRLDAEQTARLNRQIKALTPGKMLQGEVIGKNGSEVKIRLSDDLVMTARLDQDVNVEEGRVLTFEVKNNGTTLSLSPLFANTAATDNVLKALQMANLPVTQTSVSMTERMMQQGMSIDSKSLQSVFRDLVSHPGSTVPDVVSLHRMQMPVNEANLSQMESYRELTHQLVRGMTDVLAELPAAFAEAYAKDGAEAAVKMYQAVLQAVFPGQQTEQADEGGMTTNVPASMTETETAVPGQAPGATQTEEISGAVQTAEHAEAMSQPVGNTVTVLQETANAAYTLQTENGEPENGGTDLPIRLNNLPEELRGEMQMLAEKLLAGGEKAEEAMRALANLPVGTESGLTDVLKELFGSDTFNGQLQKLVWKKWSMEPELGIDSRKVDEVYNRLKSQLDGIKEALQDAGSTQSSAMKSAVNLSRNLDFMNQMNQMYTYVQLPLQMQQGRANGELYVFTNKRSLAKRDGAVSALLHLDMEHLGPVDVYVSMQNEKVNTRFTVQDDDMLLFLNDHMQLLTDRLNKKGYDMKCEMTVKNPEEAETNPVDRILEADKSTQVMMQYGFDVRA